MQGAPFKMPLVRGYLRDWFVDIRRSVATTMSPHFVLAKARSIADEIIKHERKSGQLLPMPRLN